MSELKIIAYILSYLLAIWGGSIAIEKVLSIFPLREKGGMRYAGSAIGMLERALILTFVYLNQYTAISLVLTAKSIARFEELKKRDFSEYYLISTLSSILIALVIGIIFKELAK